VILGASLLAAVLLGAMVFRSAAFRALTKSKGSFVPHAVDARIRYEPGAERFADALVPFLATAVRTVEEGHGRPFKDPFEVFLCATQESLNEFIAAPPGSPIRGTVLFGRVFIAPSAFDWEGHDTHRESLMHELSHLHLRQHLGGITDRKNMPGWFREALADLIAGSGGEGITDREAIRAILEGRALVPDSTGALFRVKRVQDYQLRGPMLHKQSTMFLSFIRERDPSAFDRFLSDLQSERSFAGPFRAHYGMSVQEMWSGFVGSLRR
jgi:hypothetical protein